MNELENYLALNNKILSLILAVLEMNYSKKIKSKSKNLLPFMLASCYLIQHKSYMKIDTLNELYICRFSYQNGLYHVAQ